MLIGIQFVSLQYQGHGLLHKAVFLGHGEVARWLVERYPETAEVRDWVSQYFSYN